MLVAMLFCLFNFICAVSSLCWSSKFRRALNYALIYWSIDLYIDHLRTEITFAIKLENVKMNDNSFLENKLYFSDHPHKKASFHTINSLSGKKLIRKSFSFDLLTRN